METQKISYLIKQDILDHGDLMINIFIGYDRNEDEKLTTNDHGDFITKYFKEQIAYNKSILRNATRP